MKTFAKLIIFAGTLLCIQAVLFLPNISLCTVRQYTLKMRTCITPFIQDLQKNPNTNCRMEMNQFIKCSAKALKICTTQADINIVVTIFKQSFSEDLMCNRAGLQLPGPCGGINMTVSCSFNLTEYTNRINRCSDNLVKKWQANKADPSLCRDYMETKRCVKNTLVQNCDMTKDNIQEMADLQRDNYNPFCASGVDPTGTSKEPSTAPSTEPSTGPSPTGSTKDPSSKATHTAESKLFAIMTMVAVYLIKP